MKKNLLSLIAISCSFLVSTQVVWANPDMLVEQGKEKLLNLNIEEHDNPVEVLNSADVDFLAALNENPHHPQANFWHGLTRICVIAQSDEAMNLLSDFGFTKNDGNPLDREALNPLNPDVKAPIDENGNLELPIGHPSISDVREFFKNTFLAEIDLALSENFSIIDENSFADTIDIGDGVREIDGGEVLACKVLLNFFSALLHSLYAYDTDELDIENLIAEIKLKFNFNNFLNTYPNFLTPSFDAGIQLAAAKSSLEAMITDLLVLIEFIQTETDDQADDLITIDESDPNIAEKIQRAQNSLNLLLASLNGPTQITLPEEEVEPGFNNKATLDLSKFFNQNVPLNLKDLLPSFTADNKFVLGSAPDPTVGGIFPDMTQVDWNYLFSGIVPELLEPIGDKEVDEGKLLEFSVSAIEPNGNITYSVQNLPQGATFMDRVFSWIPDYEQAGIYQVTFTASTALLLDSETINITVNNVNDPPVLEPIGDKTVNTRKWLKFYVHAVDPDGDRVRYGILNRPKGAAFNKRTGRFSWRPRHNQAGDFVVTFIATDNKGAYDSETITITVLNTPRS